MQIASEKRVNKNHKTLTPTEFNELVDLLEEEHIDYIFKHLACSASLETKSTIYEVNLIGDERHIINVGTISSQFFRQCDVHDIRGQYGYKEEYDSLDRLHVSWDYGVAYGYSFYNEYYSRKQLKCWSYDVNSAFAYAMLKQMPDTRQEPRFSDYIRPGEMGFYKMGGASTKVGDYADIIFPLMDSPFKGYVMKYFERKSNADSKDERRKWKDFLNIPTGLLARRNIFLRNALLYYSNQYIKSYIDDDTVYCNVDCIVSLTPRPDIPVGESLGMFKMEHNCEDFKYIKSCQYQWGKDCHYSGIPSAALTDIEDTKGWQHKLKYKIVGRKIHEN